MKPALAQSIDLKDLPRYFANDRFDVQQKIDGHRVLTELRDGVVIPYNRSGEPRPAGLPVPVLRALADGLTGHWVLDGELVGPTYFVFDLLYALDIVSPASPAGNQCDSEGELTAHGRLDVLEEFFAVWQPPPCIRLVPRASTPETKAALAKKVYENGGEGLILRDRTKPYPEGRRTSALLKAKYISDADCVVLAIKYEGKDNLVLGAYNDAGRLVEVGHCTALSGNGMDAKAGDVVTVQYLNVTDDNRLYQPTKPRTRDDKHEFECTFEQFRYVNKNVVPFQA